LHVKLFFSLFIAERKNHFSAAIFRLYLGCLRILTGRKWIKGNTRETEREREREMLPARFIQHTITSFPLFIVKSF
jgi:hypothetical protein